MGMYAVRRMSNFQTLLHYLAQAGRIKAETEAEP